MGFNIRGSVGECCQVCTQKFDGCHGVCETFLKAQAEWEEEKKRVKEAKNKALFFDRYRRDRSIKQRKIKQNHEMR